MEAMEAMEDKSGGGESEALIFDGILIFCGGTILFEQEKQSTNVLLWFNEYGIYI